MNTENFPLLEPEVEIHAFFVILFRKKKPVPLASGTRAIWDEGIMGVLHLHRDSGNKFPFICKCSTRFWYVPLLENCSQKAVLAFFPLKFFPMEIHVHLRVLQVSTSSRPFAATFSVRKYGSLFVLDVLKGPA